MNSWCGRYALYCRALILPGMPLISFTSLLKEASRVVEAKSCVIGFMIVGYRVLIADEIRMQLTILNWPEICNYLSR